MVLTLHRSNRAEFLAELLATELRLDPPDPFEPVQVVVNTWPTSRWLGEQLAVHLGGVAAHIRFPFPGSLLRRLVDRVLGEEPPPDADSAAGGDSDPWRARRLVWPVLEALPAVAAGEEGEPLRRWLDRQDGGPRLSLGTWQLARAIADAFDDYALYRPEMLREWEAGRAVDGGGEPLPEAQRWQPRLLAALRERVAGEPFGLRVERAIARLRAGAVDAGTLGGPLRLFGISSLAPAQVRLLQALSGCLPVDLYLLTPAPDLWQRCADRRHRLGDDLALGEPLDAGWLLEAPGLEARFGRLGAEFQQLLEGTGEAQLGERRESDLFLAPARAAEECTGRRPLLAQLQEQLAAPGEAEPLVREAGDHSLEFHACPGPLRQVQIVRDRLLQLLAADESLEPRDILVMTPQVDRFAPLVAAVFSDGVATGVDLPWRLTDRSQQDGAGIGRTLVALLRLAGERLTASGVEGLLDCRPLQERFGLTPEEGSQLNAVLQRVGFRWGLDGAERGGDPTHSLSWAIDRLLLGLVLPEEDGLAPGEPPTAPAASGASLEVTGRWLHLLGRLRHWLGELRRGGTCPEWIARLRSLLQDLFGDGGAAAWELPPLLAALDGWREDAGACPLVLEAPVVAAVLEESLANESGRFGHRSGALTISALEPMRAIPHRVVVLMGLDADAFPRQRDRPGFHLMERRRLLGDPHPADQDRYVLLEALLSARDHLLICWSSRDDRLGEPLPPAAPVRLWQEWLRERLGPEAFAPLLVDHAASPLERRNFQPAGERPPPSCDRRLLAARRRLDEPAPPPPTGLLDTAMPVDGVGQGVREELEPSDDLRGWLLAPQRHWLEGLGMRPREWGETINDLEALELGERERSALLRRLLETGGERVEADSAAEAGGGAEDEQLWGGLTRGRGLLPPAAAGVLEVRSLQRRWQSLRDGLAHLGAPSQAPLAWGPWRASPTWRGNTVVLAHPARERVPQHLDLWLQVLIAAAAAPASGRTPAQAVLLARDGDAFTLRLRFPAPPTDAARRELERLSTLREAWRHRLWPVPPETGWHWLAAERARPGSGPGRAREIWEGGPAVPGECRREEMVVCFGADRTAADLIDERFTDLAAELYGPVQEGMGA